MRLVSFLYVSGTRDFVLKLFIINKSLPISSPELIHRQNSQSTICIHHYFKMDLRMGPLHRNHPPSQTRK